MTELLLHDVKLEVNDSLAILTLNSPDTLNAFSRAVLQGIREALDYIEYGPDEVRCLILTGAGRAFGSGADLTEVQASATADAPTRPMDVGAQLEELYHPLLRRFRYLKCPIITAINGPCAGAAVGVALMGDMIVATKSSYFLQAFRNIGLVPDCGVTWLVPRLIGGARARELALLGEKLPAEQALEWGLINRVFEDDVMMDEAKALGQKLANGPAGQQFIRQAMWESVNNDFEDQLNVERQLQLRAGETEDFAEGVTAFLEKRKTVFTGK
jgi:2-(1,2-epoxy-1,2-dihydrophenyl)acetyl-CoA isomerase